MPIFFTMPIDDDGYKHKCNDEEKLLVACPSHGDNCRAEQCKGCEKIVSECGEFDE